MKDHLTAKEQLSLEEVPVDLSERLIGIHFTLPPEAKKLANRAHGIENMLGVAAQWGTVSLLGRFLSDYRRLPLRILDRMAQQLNLRTPPLLDYPQRANTLSEHQGWIMGALGLRIVSDQDWEELDRALGDEALVDPVPEGLEAFTVDWFRTRRILLSGATVVARAVAHAREKAEAEILDRLEVQLPDAFKAKLSEVLALEASKRTSILEWLKTPPGQPGQDAIKREMDKLRYLRGLGADRVRITDVPADRVKGLALMARKADVARIAGYTEKKRVAILGCLLSELALETADNVVEIFTRLLRKMRKAARRAAEEDESDRREERDRTIRLLGEVLRTLSAYADSPGRAVEGIRDLVPQDEWLKLAARCHELAHPDEERELDHLTRKYGTLRSFLPELLELFTFKGYGVDESVLRGIDILRQVNKGQLPGLPVDAPSDFADRMVSNRLETTADESERRRIYEFAVAEALKDNLERGDVWIDEGHRYAYFAVDLMSAEEWNRRRAEILGRLGLGGTGDQTLAQLVERFRQIVGRVGRRLGKNPFARIEGGRLRVGHVPAVEVPPEVQDKIDIVQSRLPRIMLDRLLVEIDRRLRVTRHFTHLGGESSRLEDLVPGIRACLVAEGTGMGLRRMADCAAGPSYDRLVHLDRWYLHEKPLELATRDLVAAQADSPVAKAWGQGTHTSSDGQMFEMPMDLLVGDYHPRYFAHYGRGVNVISFMDDRFTAFYTTVVAVTEREAVYVLDGLTNHRTPIEPEQHYTDTHGFTENLFALLHLLGIRFTPRLKDITAQKLYAPQDGKTRLGALTPIFDRHAIDFDLIREQWDEIGRLLGSIVLGRTIPSALLARMGSASRRNRLFMAIRELGRLVKTCFILEYLDDEKLRHQIEYRLNMQESQNALRSFLYFGQKGELRLRDPGHQRIRMRCLNLLVNCVVIWNTEAIGRVLDELRMEGIELRPEDLRHLTPLVHKHITPFGRYRFSDDEAAPFRPAGEEIEVA